MTNYNKFRRITGKRLMESGSDQASFNRWLASSRAAKSSRLTDLPSSRLPSKESLIMQDIPQLFVIIDTCSIVSYRTEFMDQVTRLNDLFGSQRCPVRFVISLPVLEELDTFNRRPQKKRNNGDTVKLEDSKAGSVTKKTFSDRNNNLGLADPKDPVLCELLATAAQLGLKDEQPRRTTTSNQLQGPPRMFARFIEEEMRMGDRIIGELDPHKEIPLKSRELNFEIVNKDDRILDCCMRTRAFIRNNPHHPDTVIILVSEDNVFKSKATTFGVASYRWREFSIKYKNFGLNNYTSTPMLPSSGHPSSSSSSSYHVSLYLGPPTAATTTGARRVFSSIGAFLQVPIEKKTEDGVIFIEEVINIE